MVSRWFNRKNIDNRKKQTLQSLGVGFAFFAVLFALTKLFGTSLCPIKNLFGLSCPGCGMTRAFIAILRFDFKTALEYNVLSVLLFCAIAFYVVLALVDVFFGKNYILAIEKQLSKKYMFVLYFLILISVTILNNIRQI